MRQVRHFLHGDGIRRPERLLSNPNITITCSDDVVVVKRKTLTKHSEFFEDRLFKDVLFTAPGTQKTEIDLPNVEGRPMSCYVQAAEEQATNPPGNSFEEKCSFVKFLQRIFAQESKIIKSHLYLRMVQVLQLCELFQNQQLASFLGDLITVSIECETNPTDVEMHVERVALAFDFLDPTGGSVQDMLRSNIVENLCEHEYATTHEKFLVVLDRHPRFAAACRTQQMINQCKRTRGEKN